MIYKPGSLLKTLILICLIFLPVTFVTAEENKCTSNENYTQVADGIFVRQGRDGITFEDSNVANIGFILGQNCVAVIDTGGSKAEGEALKCAIRQITDLPVCYVINTHFHPDHIMGNIAFRDSGATFIGHQNLPQAIGLAAATYSGRATVYEARKVSPDELKIPFVTVTTTLSIDIGKRLLEITAHDIAHTNNDLSLYDPASQTLWLSDLLFTSHTPVLAGSLNGWLETVETLRLKHAERVIPGHGPVSAVWPEAANTQIDYLTTLKKQVKTAIDEGVSLLAAQERLMNDNPWHWTLYEELRKRNIINAYAELEWE
ncbi:MAG: quinoprotein relay system zinc metallohydrolase 2 [Gammaproteobacteria bacterium]|nr:quinoprotein relay system zinc metallohydrolase 2 [Gammaproteobacteria bacterium]